MILRVIADFSFIFVLMLGDASVCSKTYDEIKLQKTFTIVQRIIFSITLMLCLLESISIEMLTPSRVVTGMNIVVAGAVAQYANLILRKHNLLHKRMVILFCLLVVISVFLFGVFYEWIQAIHL